VSGIIGTPRSRVERTIDANNAVVDAAMKGLPDKRVSFAEELVRVLCRKCGNQIGHVARGVRDGGGPLLDADGVAIGAVVYLASRWSWTIRCMALLERAEIEVPTSLECRCWKCRTYLVVSSSKLKAALTRGPTEEHPQKVDATPSTLWGLQPHRRGCGSGRE
jgi:hypothetical protein